MNKDKKMHFLIGFSITILIGLCSHIFFKVQYGYLIGLIFAIMAGALKEYVYDYKMNKGTPEAMDFIATVVGGLFAYLFLLKL